MGPISNHFHQYVDQITQVGDKLGPVVVKAAILLVIVLLLAKFLGQFLAVLLIRFGMPERRATMTVTVLHIFVLLLAALVVLNVMGFPGVLLFRVILIIVLVGISTYIISKPYIPKLPFKTGDTIQIGDIFGKVDSITFMHTMVRTFDGKMVFIPNHKVLNDKLTNLAMKPNRRLDINFFVPYHGEHRKNAKKIVTEIITNDEKVLAKPAPKVVVSKLTPDYIVMQARVWVPRTSRITTRWRLNELIMDRFEESGIEMAGPRIEVKRFDGADAAGREPDGAPDKKSEA